MIKSNERLSIRKAAKAVKRSREYLKDLARRGKVTAYRRGGTDDAPWLEFDMDELRAAIDRDSVWVPPGLKKKGRRVLADGAEIDPIVASW